MTKLQYEKNNTIKSLKNEIYGINQLIDILEKMEEFNFNQFDNKIINVRLERALNEYIEELGYVRINNNMITIRLKERYNINTKSYIGYYDMVEIPISNNITISPAGKNQYRLNKDGIIENIKTIINKLVKTMLQLENELHNIDNIVSEIEKFNELIGDFRKGKSIFLLNEFKSIRNYY